MPQLTNEDIKNTIALIKAAPIKGVEALTVALLIQKYEGALEAPKAEEPKPEEPKS